MMRSRTLASIVGMALVVAGCARPVVPDPPAEARSTAPPLPVAASSTPGLIPAAASATLSPTAVPILVSAVKGNVFIRRGPDLAFDPVSVLMDGQAATALARDVLSKWVQIAIPDQPGKTGWISIQTRFVKLDRDVTQLPEVSPTDWPVLASLRNCTHHLMEADPGGIPIPAVSDFPDNDVPLYPGTYTIHDTALDGSPEVMQVEIHEGAHIDIRTDGNGDRHKCPQP